MDANRGPHRAGTDGAGTGALAALAGATWPASMVDGSLDAILVQDAGGTILYWNAGAERLYGWSASEILGRSITAIVPDDRIDEWHAALGQVFGGVSLDAFETTRIKQDGTLVPVSLALSPLRNPRGQVVAAAALARDATSHAETERALLDRTASVDRVAERERLLSAASELLAQSLDYRATLARVGQLCVPLLADLCSIDLLNDDGTIEHVFLWHRDASSRELASSIVRRHRPCRTSASGAARVMARGSAELYPEVTPAMIRASVADPDAATSLCALGLRSALIVPMRAHDTVVGAITLLMTDDAGEYGPEDLDFAQRLADRAGTAIDNARRWKDRLAAEEHLMWQATHDPLTGLANRNYAQHRMTELLEELARRPGLLAVCFIDVDRLKEANDRHGHRVGDRLITLVAERIASTARPTDLVARIGGDEFVLVTNGLAHEHDADALARRVVDVVAAPHDDLDLFVPSVSVGLATTAVAGTSIDALVGAADAAMYEAKAAGGGQYRRAAPLLVAEPIA